MPERPLVQQGNFSSALGKQNPPPTTITLRVKGGLLFLSDTLEGLPVRLLIHPTACLGVALGPAVVFRVVRLGPVADSAIAVAVAFRWIGCHSWILRL